MEEMRKGFLMPRNNKHSGVIDITIPRLDSNQDSSNQKRVSEILIHIFADEAVLSLKTRNAKWNLCGTYFLELSSIYEIHLKQINEIIDEIAELTQKRHGQQIGSFSDYLANSRLSETPGVIPDVFQLLTDHESVIRFFREDYRNCTKFYEDMSTSELLKKFISQHEKIAWMLRSFIQKESIHYACAVNYLETN